MPVPETTKALSVKPPGEATVHEMPEPSAAPSNAAGDPKAPGSPKMAYMPVPTTTKALSVKPPGEAEVYDTPPVAPASSNASGDPKAPGSPKMAYMPVPETTKALSVKPPGEATEHEAPPSSPAPSNAAGDPKAPGSPKMAYMPVPATTKALSVKPPGEAEVHEMPAPSAAPANAAGDPKAPGSPKMAYMPVPESTKALSVKPPGEATVHEAPPATAPSNAAGDPKAPGSPKMAFMPAPAAGSGSALSVSGGHGKKEEKPAEPAPAAQPAAEAARAHPAAAKMAKSATVSAPGGIRLKAGYAGAVIGAFLGIAIWYFIVISTGREMKLLAILVGVCTAGGARLLGKGKHDKLATASGWSAIVAILLGQFLAIQHMKGELIDQIVEEGYKERIALAREAASAKTDKDVRAVMVKDEKGSFEGKGVDSITDEELTKYRLKELATLQKFANGSPSRTQYETQIRKEIEESGAANYEFRMVTLIWIAAGVTAAWKIVKPAETN